MKKDITNLRSTLEWLQEQGDVIETDVVLIFNLQGFRWN